MPFSRRVNELWCIQAVDYLVLKRDELRRCGKIWRNLKCSVRSHLGKAPHWVILSL